MSTESRNPNPDAGRKLTESDIPPDDLPDLRSTVNDLEAAVFAAAAELDIAAVHEPFVGGLLALQREPMPARQSGAVRDRSVGAGGVAEVEAALKRIASTPAEHSAWVSVEPEDALRRANALVNASARGWLHGIPIGLKDMFDRRGKAARWGARLRDDAVPAARHATLVERLEAAGAVILGTLHMAECAMSPTGLNEHLGHGSNPHHRAHASGGSSSGAGMAVAAGDVPLAIGSDTGGSVRLPAALCGVTGLKPTQFRVSTAGAMPLSPSMDCLGPLAVDADLCGLALAAMAGADPRDPACVDLPPLRPGTWRGRSARDFSVAVPRLEAGSLLTPEMLEAFTRTRHRLADAGVRIVEVPMPDLALLGQLASVTLAIESTSVHRAVLATQPEVYGRQVRRRLSRGILMSGLAYYDAQRLRVPLLRRFMAQTLSDADALMLPTSPGGAPRIADTVGPDQHRLEQEFGKLSFWTRGINYLGLPGLSVPAGVNAAGLPLGVQFIGAPYDEERLLSIGCLLQTVPDPT